jgi:hypothetical protein
MALTYWISQDGQPPAKRVATAPFALSPSGVAPIRDEDVNADVVLVPAATPGGVLAALLLRQGAAQPVRLNNVRPAPGLLELRHGDCVTVGGLTVWVAAGAPVEANYDPAVHGAELYCARTSKRLAAGEPITICPGRPDRSCGLVYKSAAFPLLACPCGFDPKSAEWRPTLLPKPTRSLDAILAIHRRTNSAV